jgi:hypothetical protein
MILPGWNDPILPLAQVAGVLGRARSTLAGYLIKYVGLGIEPTIAGSTRRLSMNEITALCFVRQMVDAGIRPGGINLSLDALRSHAEATFAEWWGDIVVGEANHFAFDVKPRFYGVFTPSTSQAAPDLVIQEQPTNQFSLSRDDLSFPLASIIIPIDDVLKICWSRSLTIMNGGDPGGLWDRAEAA